MFVHKLLFFVLVILTKTLALPAPPLQSSFESSSAPTPKTLNVSQIFPLSPTPKVQTFGSGGAVLALTPAGKAEAAKVKTLDVVGKVKERADAAQKEAKKEAANEKSKLNFNGDNILMNNLTTSKQIFL